MAIERVDATSIVNEELDKLRDAHGLEYTYAVSAAFMAGQAMQAVATLHAIAAGVPEEEVGQTTTELVERIASITSSMLGMIAKDLSSEQRTQAMADVDRIHEIAHAMLVDDKGQVH